MVVGHDVSAQTWASAVDGALSGFDALPYVLQHFHEGKKFHIGYCEQSTGEMKEMWGRVRLSPYYYVLEDGVRLAGALATAAPLDKKLIHGMVDAVMTACMVGEDA